MRLGHDIGQRRLPFNHHGYRPAPAYRDDHRWMWAADQLAAVQAPPPPPPQPAPADAAPPPDEPDASAAGSVTLHPEWDRLIQRLRPDWCRVIEPAALPAPPRALADNPALAVANRDLARRLLTPLRSLTRPLAGRGCGVDGDVFDLEALVNWQIAHRGGQARVLFPIGRRGPPDAGLGWPASRTSHSCAVWRQVRRRQWRRQQRRRRRGLRR